MKLVIRYADWTFDFIECAEEDFPELLRVIDEGKSSQGRDKYSVVRMPDDSEHMWNEAYLEQHWRSK